MSNIAGHFQHPLRARRSRAEVNGIGGCARGCATEGGAPIHQRPSTLAFPPLSFFSALRAPSFRVTSALFHPSPALFPRRPPPPPRGRFLSREREKGRRLAPLIALSEFITSNAGSPRLSGSHANAPRSARSHLARPRSVQWPGLVPRRSV